MTGGAIARLFERLPQWRGYAVGAVVLAAIIGTVAVLGVILRPGAREVMQASVSSRDFSGTMPAATPDLPDAGSAALTVQALLGKGDTAQALSIAQGAAGRWPDDPGVRRALVAALEKSGRMNEALGVATALAQTTRAVGDVRTLARVASLARRPDVQLRALLSLDAAQMTSAWEKDAIGQLRAQMAARGVVPSPGAGTIALGPPDLATRIETKRRAGDVGGALALLDGAIAARDAALPPADIVRIAYELDRTDRIFEALRTGAIATLPATAAPDLVQRAYDAGRFDWIALVDKAGGGAWRALNPWVAAQVAIKAGDKSGALSHAAQLPAADADAAREDILRRFNDVAGLRTLLNERAKKPGADRVALSDGLLALNDKTGATRIAMAHAATAPPSSAAVQRLLYLWGPRPGPDALGWLLSRANTAPDEGARREWLRLYAARARPAQALATLSGMKDADSTDMLLLRLNAANAARDGEAGRALAERLLDGRPLGHDDLSSLAARMPASATPALRLALARALAARGSASGQMQRDLAYDALRRGDATGARDTAKAYVETAPDDADGWMLLGDAEQVRGNRTAATAAWNRALALSAAQDADVSRRLDAMERLGQHRAALVLIERARAEKPDDPALIARHARLLIVTGEPARARALLHTLQKVSS